VIELTETQILVQVVVDPSPAALFAVLADPRRHPAVDGSGTVRAALSDAPVTDAGQVFTMAMHSAGRGDYVTDNHVLIFDKDHLLVWASGDQGEQPTGVRWSWQLEPAAGGRTTVVHTYDWSQVEDQSGFPRVPAEAMRRTITRLVEAATG
jgi:uncharacterized protein YndB with AHSA1/START domain